MRLAKSFEQGICIMAILATQESGVPVSSRTLQKKLHSSMTYSQKLLRKLVVSGLVKSVSGNNGGFILARPNDQITALDVVLALNDDIHSFPSTGLFSRVFPTHSDTEKQIFTSADDVVHRLFSTADSVWRQVLARVTLADLIKQVINCNSTIPLVDWNKVSSLDEINKIAVNNKETIC